MGGFHNQTRFETQRDIRKRFYYYTRSISANSRLSENGHANVLGYQLNRLFGRHHIVGVFRNNSLLFGCVKDCVMDDGVNSPCEKNPFIFYQILERDLFLLSSSVGSWESRMEDGLSECHGCDLRVFR